MVHPCSLSCSLHKGTIITTTAIWSSRIQMLLVGILTIEYRIHFYLILLPQAKQPSLITLRNLDNNNNNKISKKRKKNLKLIITIILGIAIRIWIQQQDCSYLMMTNWRIITIMLWIYSNSSNSYNNSKLSSNNNSSRIHTRCSICSSNNNNNSNSNCIINSILTMMKLNIWMKLEVMERKISIIDILINNHTIQLVIIGIMQWLRIITLLNIISIPITMDKMTMIMMKMMKGIQIIWIVIQDIKLNGQVDQRVKPNISNVVIEIFSRILEISLENSCRFTIISLRKH